MTREIIEKISSYNIFNYLLPGILFAVCIDAFTGYTVIVDNTLLGLFVYYFYGLIVSRLGSLIVEPLLRATNIVSFSDYGDFINASRKDPKIEHLSEVNNMYRTLLSLMVFVGIIYLYSIVELRLPWIVPARIPVTLLLLLLVLTFSYRKQTCYITKRIKKGLEK